MMNRTQLGVYSLVVLLLLAVGLYRSATGPDPGPPPKVKTELSREGANPGALKEPDGSEEKRTDFDGDDPAPTGYSFSNEIGASMYLYNAEQAPGLTASNYQRSLYYQSILEMGKVEKERQKRKVNPGRRWVYQGVHH